MEITTMEKDDISRKRLKKKVLDRWENEGGSLDEEVTKSPENTQMPKPENKFAKPSSQDFRVTSCVQETASVPRLRCASRPGLHIKG